MKKMSKYAIVDYRVTDIVVKRLEEYFDKVILSPKLRTYEAICGHPDIGMCKLDNRKAIVCPSAYQYYKNELPDIEIICGSSEPLDKYPNDILYNSACEKDIAIHNFKFTDKITLAQIEQKFLKRINVKQGYSKCSICFIGSGGIITDDEGIYEILNNKGLDVLKIDRGQIILKGMDYGFFGGATGYIDNKLFLNGEVKFLYDSKKILDYLKKHNTELIEINEGAVADIGTIICF